MPLSLPRLRRGSGALLLMGRPVPARARAAARPLRPVLFLDAAAPTSEREAGLYLRPCSPSHDGAMPVSVVGDGPS